MADNKNKTINFAERKKAINSKQAKAKTPVQDNRIIQYDINRMREQINQQTKSKIKKKEQSHNFRLWVKIVYGLLILAIGILLSFKIFNFNSLIKPKGLPDKFVEMPTKLSTEDTIKYEELAEDKINEVINVSGNIDVITTSIHKNNNIIFSNGYFTYPDESQKIFFDAKFKDEKITSLIVNGYELLK
ncbi:hypothetical protein [Peptostreptococcus equinus]|uniref:Uncharacterized protein n=1 Tax=Peptostreptococcus equinus TaxID=3003601 RepID=A0ABY7JUB0_9FIRM|nr:hypothetical protein [Peptostreptococcus sp. CBA3647]WAW15678.1 hypothetical protein O0R46_04310 [Peptostreptococcus sp. CBA3647]